MTPGLLCGNLGTNSHDEEFMDTVRLTTFFRPPKLTFVAENSDQVLRAMKVSTVLWGGVYNEIWPAEKAFHVGEPLPSDFIVVCDKSIAVSKDFEKKTKQIEELFYKSDHAKGALFLDTIGIYEEIKERQVKSTIAQSSATELNKVFRCGGFPDNAPKNYELAYKTILFAETVDFDVSVPHVRQAAPLYSPIDLTGVKYVFKGSRRERGIIFFLADPSSHLDILFAWNLRARGNRVCFIDRANVDADLERIAIWKEQRLKDMATSGPRMRFPPSAYVTSVDLEPDITILRRIAEKLRTSIQELSAFFEVPKDPFDLFPKTETKSRMAFMKDRMLTFEIEYPTYADETSNYTDQIGVCFSFPSLYSQGADHLQHVPRLDQVERCLLSGTHRDDGARINGSVVTLFGSLFGSTQTVWLNPPWEFWRIHFWGKKLEMRPSNAGHNLRNIIDSQGGINAGTPF